MKSPSHKSWDGVLPWPVIEDIAERFKIDRYLIAAIIMQESGGSQYACRFEPGWRWFLSIPHYAKRNGITENTERVMQSTSWGLMQIIGSTAREMGFNGPLPALCEIENNIIYGSAYLAKLWLKYGIMSDVISAYNQGSAKKGKDGKYANQKYVDSVLAWMSRLHGDGPGTSKH